eukprot:SAG25_NODE_322_length_9886_cov_11.794217_17_plen_58_part_00
MVQLIQVKLTGALAKTQDFFCTPPVLGSVLEYCNFSRWGHLAARGSAQLLNLVQLYS